MEQLRPGGPGGDATDLTVTGRLPEGLSGHFIRNGPNPVAPPTGPYNWFGGDGILHVVVLDAEDVAAGPVATVALPQRVPAGFHGTWFAAV